MPSGSMSPPLARGPVPFLFGMLLLCLPACRRDPAPYDPSQLEPALPRVLAALRAGDPESALALIAERRRSGTAPDGIDHFEGLAYADAGRPADAAQALGRELEAHPGNGLAQLLLAEALGDLGRLEEARPHLDRAARMIPTEPYVDLVRARLDLAADDDQGAAAAYSRYLEQDRTSARAAEAHHALAQFARAAGELEQANAHEERSSHLEQVHQYLNAYRERLLQNPGDSDAALGAGMIYLDLFRHVSAEPGLLAQAKEALRACLAIDPDSTRALYNLGFAELASGNLEAAARLWDQTLERDPGHVGALLNAGLLASRQGDLRSARERLSQALERADNDRDRVRAHLGLGQVLQALGEADLAAQHLAAAAALDPDSSRSAGKPQRTDRGE